ncbi:uncharacterized protein VTP21DRAFT_666 [Calcarisporiella thermophila]|uniref:uncharacterized protein n=1 Tax=Calcarisporiella thermophila TaxID=911321 RepID=UPI003742F407
MATAPPNAQPVAEILSQINTTISSAQLRLSFFGGVIVGQFITIAIVILFMHYLFSENRTTTTMKIHTRQQQKTASSPSKPLSPDKRVTHILMKTFYEIYSHPSEAIDWANVLGAQLLTHYRHDPQVKIDLMQWVDRLLNNVRPSFIGPIHIEGLTLGEEFPLFSNVRIRPSNKAGLLRAEIDVEYADEITISLDTRVLVNWPKPCVAALPVSLTLSVVKFSATMTLEFVSTPPDRYLVISLLPDFDIEFSVGSAIGSRTRLTDVPKVTELVCNRLRNFIIDKYVVPNGYRRKIL